MIAPPAALAQYRRRHAEPEADEVRAPRAFHQVAVVPAMGEYELLVPAVEAILAAEGAEDAGLIVVLNARESSPPDVHETNERARRWLADLDPERVVVLDRASEGRRLPDKQGVGLARKVGNDVALAWRMAGRVTCRFVLQTDADAVVPPDWFARAAAAEDERGTAALTYPYRHAAVPPVEPEAIARYETWLRTHRLGLARAGSPYAFQAIGSTLAIDAEALALARGFPRAMAGEDFYVLDKLAKIGTIRPLGGRPIVLAARESDRVPFGTGRAMLAGADLPSLDPRAYEALAAWLEVLVAATDGSGTADTRTDTIAHLSARGLAPEPIVAILERMGAFRFTDEARAMNLSPAVRFRRLHTWFDAFRTLRFLHSVRDEVWPSATRFGNESAMAELAAVREADEAAQAVDAPAGLAYPAPARGAIDRFPRLS